MQLVIGANGSIRAAHLHALMLDAFKMHFDTMLLAVEKSMMLEAAQIEFSAKLAIEAHQQIAIELGCYSRGVVVSVIQYRFILDQIDADHECRADLRHPTRRYETPTARRSGGA